MNIIEKIKRDDVPEAEHKPAYPLGELRALAESFERLLLTAKVVVFNNPEIQSYRDDLKVAIEEAEKI